MCLKGEIVRESELHCNLPPGCLGVFFGGGGGGLEDKGLLMGCYITGVSYIDAYLKLCAIF